MPFTDESQIKVAFKKLIGRAHTTNDKEFFNEAKFSQISIFAFEVFGQNVPSDPQQAINEGLVEYVEADLVLDGTSNGKSYTARFPSGYNGFFGAGVAGSDIGPVASAIPASINSSLVDSGHTGGFAPGLYDNGVLVPATSTEDWIFDPVAMTVTSEDDLGLGSTGTLQIYLYIGKTVQDHIDDTNNPHQVALADLTDLNISGSMAPDDGDLLIFVGGSLNEWQTIPSSSVGVTDHGDLTGLSDDDHTQYVINGPGDDTRNVIQPTSSPRRALRIMSSTDGPGTWDFFDVTRANGTQLMRFENDSGAYSLFFENSLSTVFDVNAYFHNSISLTDSNDSLSRAVRLASPTTLANVLGYTITFPNVVGDVGEIPIVIGGGPVESELGWGRLSLNDLTDVVIGDSLQDGYILQYVGGSIDEWQAVNAGAIGGGVTDHGELDGLSDDDHTQYVVKTPGSSSRNVIQPSSNLSALTLKGFSASAGPLLLVTDTSDQSLFQVDQNDGSISFGGATASNQTLLVSDAGGTQKTATFPNVTGEVVLTAGSQVISGTKIFTSLDLAVQGGGAFSSFFRSAATATQIIDIPDASGNMVLVGSAPVGEGYFIRSTGASILADWQLLTLADLPDISLDDLSDVVDSGASDGDVLVFVGGSLNYWEPQTIANIDNIAASDASYITAVTESSLSQSRLLVQGTGIQILDSGGGSTIVVSTNDSEIDHSALLNLTQDDHQQYVHTDPSSSARNLVTSGGSAVIPLTIRGDASQSADLFLIETSASAELFAIAADGNLIARGSIQGGGSAGTADSVAFILDNSGLGGGPRTFTFPNNGGEILTANASQTITGTKTFDFNDLRFSGPSTSHGWILTTTKASGGFDSLLVPAITTGVLSMLVTENTTVSAGEVAVAADSTVGNIDFRALGVSDLPDIDLDDLADVDATNPTDGYVLTYIGGSINTWQAQPLPSDSVGIQSINGQTGSIQTFSDVDDTNVTLTISSSANDHEFSLGWSGDLSVSRGGTGLSTLTDGAVLIGNGSSAIQSVGMDSGEILIGNGLGSNPSSAFLTEGTGISITSGSGSIEISTNDSEIDHGSLSGLADDDHSQYIHESPLVSSRNLITALGTTIIPLTLRAAPGHTANLFVIENSAGTDLAVFDSSGGLTLSDSGAHINLETDSQSIRIGNTSGFSGASIYSVGDGGTRDFVLDYYGTTSNSSSEIILRRARGSFASPGNLSTIGDDMGSISWWGYNSSAGAFIETAKIVAETTEAFGSNAGGTQLEFRTLNESVPGSPSAKLRIGDEGVRSIDTFYLTNVSEVSSTDYVLAYNETTDEVSRIVFDVAALSDINTTGADDGDILVYDGGSVDQWRPFSIPGSDGNLLYRDQSRIGALPRLNWDDSLQTLILGVQQTGENSAITDSLLELIGDGTKMADVCLTQASNDVTSPGLVFWKSRGSLNVPANVQDSDRLGEFFFYGQTGAAGNNGYGIGGSITFDVDGTPAGASNFVPSTLTVNVSDGTTISAMVQIVNNSHTELNSDVRILDQNELRFYESGSTNYVAFQAAASMSGDVTYTWPDADGSSNEYLSTNGAGVLSWGNSTGLLDATGANRLVHVNSTNDGLTSVSSMLVNGNELTMGSAGVQGEIYIVSGGAGGISFQELPFQGDHVAKIVSDTSYSTDYELTLPGITGTFMMLEGTQTVSGVKTFDNNTFRLDGAGSGYAAITYTVSAVNRNYLIPSTQDNSTSFVIANTSSQSNQALFATGVAGSPEFRDITADDISDFNLGSAEDNSYLRYVGGSQNEWVSEVIPGSNGSLFYNNDGIFGSISRLNWDEANDALILGDSKSKQFSTIPGLSFEISGEGASPTGLNVSVSTSSGSPLILMTRSRGDLQNQTDVTDDDFIGQLVYYAHNSSVTDYSLAGVMQLRVENFTLGTTYLPTRFEFQVGNSTGTSLLTPLTINADGLSVSGDVLASGNVVISGDLMVQGTTTTIDTQNLIVEDNFIVVNSMGIVQNAGIEVDRGHAGSGNNAFLLFDEDVDEWYVDNSFGSWQIAKKFAATITGTGADSTFTITHGMNTTDVVVQVYNSSDEQVSVQVEASSADDVDITFKTSPAMAVTYRVVVVG